MNIDFDNFNAETFLQEVIHMATKQIPGGGDKVVNYVIDSIFFPKSDVDKTEALWKKLEKKVAAMVSTQVEDEVQRVVGEMAAGNLLNRLRNFGNLFRQLAYISNLPERKLHLLLLTNEANSLVADINTIPGLYLLPAAKLLQVISAAHIAAIMQLKDLEPDAYKHQSSLNNMAILYSDTAGGMFQRSMAFRRSMIAEGKGVLHERDVGVDTRVLEIEKKEVVFTAYDKYAGNHYHAGEGSVAVMTRTPPIPKGGGLIEYGAAKEEAYRLLREYDQKVQQEWTETWNRALLKVTQSFMQLVDWPGVEREKKGELPRLPDQRVFPVVPSRSAHHSAEALERIDLFLEQQMDQFTVSGPRYAQTYRPPAAGFGGDHHLVYYRADTYDTAMACIYFLVRGDVARARDLGDGIVQALNHDPKGGGRIVATTMANRLLDPAQNFATSIYVPDGGRRDVGNLSWAGIALTRLYHRTRTHRYLNAAETIGQWILDHCTKEDPWRGFTGGEDHWGGKYHWRSVEHNVDCVAFFDNLHQLTGKAVWETARESARTLVKACLVDERYYITGTGEQQDLNAGVAPTDCQSWVSLARIDPATEARSLHYMIDAMQAESGGFVGTKFARDGAEIQNEATAGAAMALWFARGVDAAFETTAQAYIDSLTRQITEAPNSIGYGVVATPAEAADTGPGLGWKYFNYLHVASSAWTGLAILGQENHAANPYASLESV
ncbi:hypothetical protein [Endothiovibrio diazotrophicus]